MLYMHISLSLNLRLWLSMCMVSHYLLNLTACIMFCCRLLVFRYKLVDKIPIKLGLADGRFTTIWQGKDLTNNKDVILKVCVIV
jgi:hypothetical protein